MAASNKRIVTGYAKMWSREVFHMKESNKDSKLLLQGPGVYVLYRDDVPYYVGKTSERLWKRIRAHANRPTDRYYHFWNYFSAFIIPNAKHLDEIEGVLIASMPTENGAIRKIPRINIPQPIAKQLHELHYGKPQV